MCCAPKINLGRVRRCAQDKSSHGCACKLTSSSFSSSSRFTGSPSHCSTVHVKKNKRTYKELSERKSHKTAMEQRHSPAFQADCFVLQRQLNSRG